MISSIGGFSTKRSVISCSAVIRAISSAGEMSPGSKRSVSATMSAAPASPPSTSP